MIENIAIGDILRTMTWEELEEKYGLDADGSIATPIPFTQQMSFICGKTFTISKIDRDVYGLFYRSHERCEMIDDEHSAITGIKKGYKIRDFIFVDPEPIKDISQFAFEKIISQQRV